jgi:hypothetical protein
MTRRTALQIRMQVYRDYRVGKISYADAQRIIAWTKKS